MQYYFTLRYKSLLRFMSESEIHPVLGVSLVMAVFCSFCGLLFYKTAYAPYILSAMPLYLGWSVSSVEEREFLSSIYDRRSFQLLRFLEGLLVSLPFVVVLFATGHYLLGAGAVVAGVVSRMLTTKSSLSYVLPTPFGRFPFEFAVGFRRMILVLVGIIGLLTVAIYVDNENLALVCILAVGAMGLSFYSELEASHFVDCHQMTATEFLWHKSSILIRYSTLLFVIPVGLVILYFQDSYVAVILIVCISISSQLLTLYIKYSRYPHPPSLPESIMLFIGIFMPPIQLLLLPYYFRKASRSLSPTLL